MRLGRRCSYATSKGAKRTPGVPIALIECPCASFYDVNTLAGRKRAQQLAAADLAGVDLFCGLPCKTGAPESDCDDPCALAPKHNGPHKCDQQVQAESEAMLGVAK